MIASRLCKIDPQKLNTGLPYGPAMLSSYPTELKTGTQILYINDVHGSIIHNNRNVDLTQMSISGRMDKM